MSEVTIYVNTNVCFPAKADTQLDVFGPASQEIFLELSAEGV